MFCIVEKKEVDDTRFTIKRDGTYPKICDVCREIRRERQNKRRQEIKKELAKVYVVSPTTLVAYCRNEFKTVPVSEFTAVNGVYPNICDKCQEKKKLFRDQNRDRINKERRERYNKDPEYKRKRSKDNLVIKIGRILKSEILMEPRFTSKNLWNGRGEWSQEYDRCTDCMLTIYRHQAFGLCSSCYSKMRYENNREREIEKSRKYYENNKEQVSERVSEYRNKMSKEARKYIEMAKSGKVPMTPKIDNLLNNLGE